MPKILRIINRLNIGGPTYNAAYLTRYLAPKYDTVLVAGQIDATEGDSSYVVRDLGIEPLYIRDMHRSLHPVRDWRGYWQLRRIIRQHRPDIVHTHAAKAGTLGRLAAHHERVPVVVHTFHGHVFHSYFSPAKTRLFLEIERAMARISTGIVAISELQRRELAEHFRIAPASKFHLVPNGFDLSRFQAHRAERRTAFRQRYGIDDAVVAIGIVGRLVPVKNHAMFLQAFARLKQLTDVPVKAVIIGDGEDRALVEQQAAALGLQATSGAVPSAAADVVFTSWIKEVDQAYPGLDIVALTSRNEGTPVSLVEAQAAGLPVVSTEVGGVADTVLPGASALLVASGDVEGFAQALRALVADPQRRAAFAQAGQAHALAQYGYERLVRDMDALYERLLAQPQRRE